MAPLKKGKVKARFRRPWRFAYVRCTARLCTFREKHPWPAVIGWVSDTPERRRGCPKCKRVGTLLIERPISR